MACPLFLPVAPLNDVVAITAPLGELHGGVCSADPVAVIPDDLLHTVCNFGYGRGRCERATRSDADAVRFLVTSADETTVNIAWSTELDHHPVAVGVLRVEPGNDPQTDDTLMRQAHACASAYLRSVQR